MEEGEPLSSLTWACRRLCPFLGASRPSSSLVAVVIVGGRGCQWRVVSWSVGSWSSVALAVRGWVVVVCGARRSRMGRGRPWALDLHEWGVVVVNVGVVRGRSTWVGSGRLWAGRPCGVSSVGGRGRPWGGVVFISVGAVAVVVIRMCEVVVVVVCGCSWSRVGVLIIHVGGRRPWVLVVNGGWW